MMQYFRVASLIGVCATLLTLQVKAQSCTGNGDVGGSYGIAGLRSVFAGVPVTAPGTNGATGSGSGTNTGTGNDSNGQGGTQNVSATPIGQLIGGISGSSPFSVVGRIVADGAGTLLASSSPTGALTAVGNYTVNSDCTISMTINDVFIGMPVTGPGTSGTSGVGTPTTGANGSTTTSSTPATIALQGIVLERGAEVDLFQPGTFQPGTSGSGAIVVMRRALQFGGCTDASLSGAFGFVAQGSEPGTSTSTTGGNTVAAALIGRMTADGTGNFMRDALASQSPLQDLQITGTYNVADDCSGTAQITDSNGGTHNLSFMIVQGGNVSVTPGPQQGFRPELLFAPTDQGTISVGFAKHE